MDACRAFERSDRCLERLGVATDPKYSVCGHDAYSAASVDTLDLVHFFCGN